MANKLHLNDTGWLFFPCITAKHVKTATWERFFMELQWNALSTIQMCNSYHLIMLGFSCIGKQNITKIGIWEQIYQNADYFSNIRIWLAWFPPFLDSVTKKSDCQKLVMLKNPFCWCSRQNIISHEGWEQNYNVHMWYIKRK